MNKTKIKRYTILAILFFLPVIFLLVFYPAKHNYQALDVVQNQVASFDMFSQPSTPKLALKNHITVLGFIGNNPKSKLVSMLNLKELIYDKFKGFKTFQVIMVVPETQKATMQEIKNQVSTYEHLKYWHYLYGSENQIKQLYHSLNLTTNLDDNLATNNVVIIDKELQLRGRIDDRSDTEKQQNKPIYPLKAYNCIEVATLKNKMSEDLRILFTEYRQKRKGQFNSETRRASELKNVKDEKK